jgi:3-hydroxyisobutyrate dehydrogenase-like beta-hydroxyacid dehydrogenase
MDKLGFIGLGVMGEPMCRNLAAKHRGRVFAHDIRPEPLKRLSVDGVTAARSIQELAAQADVIFLSLPAEPQVRAVGLELSLAARPGQAIVDCSTAPVALARELESAFNARGAHFADAPVARTRQAAIDGTLAFMVGCDGFLFHRIEPLLRAMGSDVIHCGAAGAGQAVKLLNNMVLSATVTALAEAMAVAKASGLVEPKVLFEALAKGSADSFALRNHGMKSLLPESHPQRAFPVSYMLKDVSYALEFARDAGLELQSAGTIKRLLDETAALGFAEAYHTAVIEAVRRHRAGAGG